VDTCSPHTDPKTCTCGCVRRDAEVGACVVVAVCVCVCVGGVQHTGQVDLIVKDSDDTMKTSRTLDAFYRAVVLALIDARLVEFCELFAITCFNRLPLLQPVAGRSAGQ
jgi:hypothetical protein